ncbi:MAG: hypothetical protein KGM99_01920 [Burkholderiales bacterium]|nr:hypothetical protein [Burkholderiales bacterium]
MDAGPLVQMFLFGFALPIVLGFALSFWIVGKGNHLLWLFLSILIWFGVHWLIARINGKQITGLLLAAQWIATAVLILFAFIVRKLRPVKQVSRTEENQGPEP